MNGQLVQMHVCEIEKRCFGFAHWWTAALLINDPVRVSPEYAIFREYGRGLSKFYSVRRFICENGCLVMAPDGLAKIALLYF